MIMSDELSPHIQKLVDLGETGTNIMHGELKNWMYDAEQQLDPLDKTEAELQYWNGRLDALTDLYVMTYNLAFAINERAQKRGR